MNTTLQAINVYILEDKLNVAMVISICNYDEKMEEMLETGTYRKLKEDSTATPGE